jgi:PKD repeat protein
MKKIRYTRLAGILAIILAVAACEPQMADKPDIGAAPTADQLNFTITPGSDEFNFVIENTSSITGIASWDFGNGTKGTGNSNVARYPMPGNYTVKLTLVTRGGFATLTKTLTQTETDFSIFTDPVYVNLTGGVDDADGKTWVVDADSKGHFGVGDVTKPYLLGLDWWSANPHDKDGTGAYDDELTFILTDFIVKYDNKGVSYVKGYTKDDPALATVYLNPRQNKDDWDVDYATPVTGNWSIVEKNGENYIIINSATPIFPGLDVGAKDHTYKILQIDENLLELTCESSYESWTLWHYFLIPKGYVRPTITYTVDATEGVDNDVACSVTGYTIPDGQSVTNVTWNFGDNSPEVTAGKDEVVHHTFMRRGIYTVTAKLNTSLGILTGTKVVTLVNDNSAYIPYLLDMMIVYNDFSEVQIYPVLGQDCGVTIVDNPMKEVPNRSSKVAFYTKTNNQWANAYMQLGPGFRFDLRQQHIFTIMVYGNAGDKVLLKLENTDKGGDAWQTGTELTYTIQATNKWELATYNFSGADVQPGAEGWKWWPDPVSYDVVADDYYNHDFYNIVRIMLNPGVGDGTHSFYLDDLSGPHVEGIHK